MEPYNLPSVDDIPLQQPISNVLPTDIVLTEDMLGWILAQLEESRDNQTNRDNYVLCGKELEEFQAKIDLLDKAYQQCPMCQNAKWILRRVQ